MVFLLIDNDDDGKSNGYANIIIRNLLQAMKLNSDKARLRFPRLLQLIEKFPETSDVFEKQVINLFYSCDLNIEISGEDVCSCLDNLFSL